MKLLIFILGLAVASATITISTKPKETFVPHTYQDVGKSFIYRYEAFLNSTLPQSGVEFVGQKILCDVELNVITTDLIHMNLTNILVQEVNGTYNATLKEKNILYPVNVTVWNSSLTKNYTEELKNPITFQYVDGKIPKVFANKTDPEWVVNMKKGIMNMLTIKLENDNIFEKKEESIAGVCQTVYQVTERYTKDNVKVFNVTKVTDMTNCTDAPTTLYKTLDTKECSDCDKEVTQQMKAIATFKYNITGERNQVFIESCTSDASYVMVPQTSFDKGSYAVFQNQSLVLKEVKSKEVRPLMDLQERGSIKYVFPEIVNDVDRWNTTLKKVEFFTNVLSNQSFTNFTMDTPSHFIHLVKSLRECNITQMRQVWNWTEKTTYKRDWIVKALPFVNKTETTLLVKEMFFNRTINVTRHGEAILLGLGTIQSPTIKMIQDLRDVCEMDTFREPSMDLPRENITKTLSCRRACFVSLGNMIHRFYKVEKFVPTTIVRSLSDCEETWRNPQMNPSIINKETYKMLLEFRKTDVKLHCVEAQGNAGLVDHIETLRETIEQTIEPQPIDCRLAAITALRRMAPEVPRKVMSICLPILKNPTEDSEVKITCYLTILECKPTPAMLTLAVEEINKWTDPEVRHFVYTHLKNLAWSTNPLEKKISMSARYAVLFLHPMNTTFKTSQNRRIEYFTDDKKMGVKCELDTVFSKQNIIPRKVNTKCDIAFNGNFLNLLELNVHTASINDVVDRVFGKNGSWNKRKSVFDMLTEKRTQDTMDHTKLELNRIKSKVSPYTKKTYRHASTQFKMMDTEMWYQKLDDTFFEDIMDVGKLSTKMRDIEMDLIKPQHFNFTKVMMVENSKQFPTVMGLPLSINMTISTIARVMVNTTFMATPSLQDVTHTDLVAKVNVTPEIIMLNTRTFGCHTPLNKIVSETNNTVNMTMPLSTRIIIDYETKNYKVEIDHMQKNRVDLLTVKHNVSLIHEKTMCGKNQIFRRNITTINGTQTGRPINTTMCFQPFDDSAKLCVNVTTFVGKRDTPIIALRGPMLLEVFAKKGTYTPDKVVVEYEPRDLHLWSTGVKSGFLKLRFVADKTRTDFDERFITADMELTDRTPLIRNWGDEDWYTLTVTMKRSDIPEWRAKIKGFQRWTKNVHMDCQWGMPMEQTIMVNNTQTVIQREFFVRFVSDRWILPTHTVHNVTMLWANVPQWCKTIGQTYKTYAPLVKHTLVRTCTPWEITTEPKRHHIDNAYTMCLKTKTNETVDMIWTMPDQEITIRNITTPVHTNFLNNSLPNIVNAILKPNITIIPLPTTCKINSTGIKTFDNVKVNYTMPGSCPHILVRDCSSDERFTVLVQNVTLREERDTVKTGLKSIVYVSKRKFELITKLDYDLTSKILEVKVDGVKFLDNWRNQNKPTVEVEVENTNTTLRRNATHITLISGQGITVVLSTEDLQVNVTQRHWNTTCGLCGNNDGEMDSEFRTPWTTTPTHVTNATKFGISWVVPGDDCNDPECKLRKYTSFPLFLIDREDVMIGNTKAACFSIEPVFYCPKDCTPATMNEVYPNSYYTPEKKTVEVSFSCLRTKDPIAEYRKMKDMSFTNKVADLVKEVEVPQKCLCQNTCIESNRQW